MTKDVNGTPPSLSFDDLVDCAVDTYGAVYENMGIFAAGLLEAFEAVKNQMRSGRLTVDDCDDDSPWVPLLLVDHLGLVGAVAGMTASMEDGLYSTASPVGRKWSSNCSTR